MTKRKATQKRNEPQIVEVDELGIPLARPPQEEIDEDEQWRLINDTGILKNLPGQEEEELTPLADSIREYLVFHPKKPF